MIHLRKALSKYKVSELCFGIFLFLAAVYMSFICYCDTISGDEYFSVGFSNNTEDFLCLTGSTLNAYSSDGWIDGEFLNEYLTVQEGERFAILDIHRNVRDDVHPPLYFMLLNVLSSFFIDEIPYFAGFFINMISGILICVFLYLIGRKVFRNQWLAMAAPILWIGTSGAEVLLTYLRMYAPLSALCLICIYLHVLLFEKEKVSKWLYVSLAVCTMIGTLTHYYFYIMLAVIGLISTIRLFYQKKIKKFMIYALSHAGGWAIAFMAYPYVFEHVLFSERSVGAQASEKSDGLNYYINFARQFKNTIDEFVYSNHLVSITVSFIFLCVIAGIVALCRRNKDIEVIDGGIFAAKESKVTLVVIGCYALLYLLILLKISYSSRWLYLSPTFPLLILLTVGVFAWVLEKIEKGNKYSYLLLAIGIVTTVCAVKMHAQEDAEAHAGRTQRHEAITAYSDRCDAIFYYTKWNNLYNNQIQELMEFDQIYSINIAEIETADYTTILDNRRQNRDLVVYIPIETDDYEQKAQSLAQEIGTGELAVIVEDTFAVYYIDVE